MILELTTINDKKARSFVCAEAIENGAFAQIKGLAPASMIGRFGIGGEGEAFEVEALTDDATNLFVIAAPDLPEKYRYKDEYRYNFCDYDAIPAKELFRGYILSKGDRVKVEKAIITGSVNDGDILTVNEGTNTLKKHETGTSKTAVARVLATCKLAGKDAYDIIFL